MIRGNAPRLWQQRQRAHQLLQVASEYGDFPVVLEAMRECLQDVFDVPGLRGLMADLASRTVRVVEVETESASPFAQSLLFGYVGAFLYEADAPLAERRAQALSLDPALLAELLGTTELRELLDADAITTLEAELQRLAPERRATSIDGVHDLLRWLGDLTTAEAIERGATAQWLAELEATRRAIRVRIAGDERWLAIEDAGRVRDALGVPLPVGVPEAFTEPVRDPVGDLVARYARTNGPFHADQVGTRLGYGSRGRCGGARAAASRRPGGCRASSARVGRAANGATTRCCARSGDGRWRRCGARSSRCRPRRWPGSPRRGKGWPSGRRPGAWPDSPAIIEQLAGAPIAASALESLVLPSRVADYAPALLDQLTLAGDVVWAGAGSIGSTDGWVVLAPADGAALLLPEIGPITTTPILDAISASLAGDQALFFRSLADAADTDSADDDRVTDDQVIAAIWELVWSGQLTNDTLAPIRALVAGAPRRGSGRPARPPQRFGRYTGLSGTRPLVRTAPPAMSGRWSRLPDREPDPTARAIAAAEVMLDRYGVLTRGAVVAERLTGGFSAVYPVLKAAEEHGRVRRGYFVDGLGAAQFALPGAVERLRAARSDDVPTLVLAATDPANPYGAVLPWPRPMASTEGRTGHQPARKAGALVVLVDGACALYVERGGRTLLSFTDDVQVLQPAADALALTVRDGVLGKLAVERADGAPVVTTALGEALAAAGFRPTPRGLRLRG